jgi:ATP synthase protein I
MGAALRAAAPYIALGWTFVIPMVLGLVVGYYLDRWLGTAPWILLTCLLLGMAAGFLSLYSAALRLAARNRRKGR